MTGYLRLLATLSVLTLLSGIAFAQPASLSQSQPPEPAAGLSDTTAFLPAELATIEFYHQYMGQESRLLNGTEHASYPPLIGDPYFLDANPKVGTIFYEGTLYAHVKMLYDIIRDEVIVPSPSGGMLALSKQKVNDFFFLGHHFISTPTGYYDQLCTGTVILLAKRVKVIRETIEGLEVVRHIDYHEYFYAIKDGNRYSISNLHVLLKLLKDKKTDINQDLKRKGIRYKKDHEKALVEAAGFYNQSTSKSLK